jgi:hypothetical protein
MAELITGRIYSVRSPNTDMVYIGSTIQTLKRRLQGHISDWRHKKEMYITSFLILEKGEAYIELLEEVLVENERELERLEQIWIDNTDNAVNKNKSYRTIEEKVEYLHQYNMNRKDEQAEYCRNYYEENRQKLNERNRKYNKDHKEKLSEIRREKVLCEICDCYVSRGNIRQHERTAKHARNLEKS